MKLRQDTGPCDHRCDRSKPASVAERIRHAMGLIAGQSQGKFACVIVARDRVLANRPLQCARAFPPVPWPMHSAQLFPCV